MSRQALDQMRVLPIGRIAGLLPWMIAVMTLLLLLSAAAAALLDRFAHVVGDGAHRRATVQIVEADRVVRDARAVDVLRALRQTPGVMRAERVSDGALAAQLTPWLGASGLAADLPLPALIEVELTSPSALARVRAVAGGAVVTSDARQMRPILRLAASLGWLAVLTMALVTSAAIACVVLAAGIALDRHRPTLEVAHLLGAEDRQIARMIERRVAFESLIGALFGVVAASIILWSILRRVSGGMSAETIGMTALAATAVVILMVGIAVVTARVTAFRALRRMT